MVRLRLTHPLLSTIFLPQYHQGGSNLPHRPLSGISISSVGGLYQRGKAYSLQMKTLIDVFGAEEGAPWQKKVTVSMVAAQQAKVGTRYAHKRMNEADDGQLSDSAVKLRRVSRGPRSRSLSEQDQRVSSAIAKRNRSTTGSGSTTIL